LGGSATSDTTTDTTNNTDSSSSDTDSSSSDTGSNSDTSSDSTSGDSDGSSGGGDGGTTGDPKPCITTECVAWDQHGQCITAVITINPDCLSDDSKSFAKAGSDCPDCPNTDGGVGVLTEGLGAAEFFFDNNLIDPEWIDEIGNYLGRPSLKYSQKAIYPNGDQAYKLDLGPILYVSQSKRYLSGHDPSNSIIASTEDTGPFYYMKNNGDWFEVSIDDFQTDCLSCDIEYLFAKVEIAALKFTGRYIIPVEDFIILFDGTDFDGNEANQYLAGGMLIVSIIPGGKILKAVKIIPGSEIAWKKIVRWGENSATLTYTVINGLIDFGNRSQLAQLLGTTANIEAHHIIPWIAGGTHDVVQAAARNGFHLNMIENGIGLEKFTTLVGTGLHGNHPAYDRYVLKRLDDFSEQGSNFTPEQANNFISNQLIPDLKGFIVTASDSGLNLNEYFKQVVNPSIGI